ncbi:AIM24 family protein [Nocardioides houyundeii]|uniref:AIM24 family protein n=1 Tax=Nocardioides houyundeii TaxID=2045452 RepID=UPI000C771AC3|nr:AIM24 family protein [Nocardioides houyundeii]
MRSELFDQVNEERATAERFSLHHRKTLRAVLGEPVLAAKGAMVAYQGQVSFEHKSAGSLGKMMRRLVTSEDTPLMTVAGQGEVFFADAAKDIFLVHLEGDGLSVNGSSLLAMDASLEYDVHRVKGAGMMTGGMFNTLIQGTGTVALTSDGPPLILDCSQTPTAVDINAAVCWSAGLTPQVVSSMNMRSMLRGGTGEAFQYSFHGPGIVVVQPSEGPVVPPHSHGSGS